MRLKITTTVEVVGLNDDTFITTQVAHQTVGNPLHIAKVGGEMVFATFADTRRALIGRFGTTDEDRSPTP